MIWYCEKCKCTHNDDELCPNIRKQLKDKPELLIRASDITTIVGDYQLSTSQALDVVAKQINEVCSTNFSYEGGRQIGRDIQVFKRIYEEKKFGKGFNAEIAKNYAEKASSGQLNNINTQFTGYQNEVDWYLKMKGDIKSILFEAELDVNNTPGRDGIIRNRITGKQYVMTAKASTDKGERTAKNIEQNIKKVKEAIETGKGGVDENTIIVGPKGTAEATKNVGLNNTVQEIGDPKKIAEGNKRLFEKMIKGEGYSVPNSIVLKKAAAQGAIVGAAVGLTISSITAYVRYTNDEISFEESIAQVSEDIIKSAICGAATNSLVLFVPFGGGMGFAIGALVGVYVNATTTNILDEIYGKGAYGAIFDSAGYVHGMAINLDEYYRKFLNNESITNQTLQKATVIHKQAQENFLLFTELEENC